MKHLAARLLHDTNGAINPATYLLVVVLLALGVIPALTTIRNHVVQEFGDAAVALDKLDQSYTFTVNGTVSAFSDTSTLDDPVGGEPAGISVRQAPSAE